MTRSRFPQARSRCVSYPAADRKPRTLPAVVRFLAGAWWATTLLGLCSASSAHAQGTTQLRGRVVALGQASVTGLRLRAVQYGTATVSSSGEFRLEIPAGVDAVTLVPQDTPWSVVYPPDARIVVPRGNETVVLVVGEPVERTITRALAERRRESLQLLQQLGVQSEQTGHIEQKMDEALQLLRLRREDLIDETARGQRQAVEYPAMAEALRHWSQMARDLNTKFRLALTILDKPKQELLDALEGAVRDYNDAYTAVVPKREQFETALQQDWPDGAGARRDLADLLDNVLLPLHQQHILPLNEQLIAIQAAATKHTNDARAHNAIAELTRRLPDYARALDAADVRLNRTIEQLRPR